MVTGSPDGTTMTELDDRGSFGPWARAGDETLRATAMTATGIQTGARIWVAAMKQRAYRRTPVASRRISRLDGRFRP
jgi:hypothetical protein